MNEKEIMLNTFSKYFNKTDEELTEMLYDKGEDDTEVLKEGVVEQLIALDTNRVERLRTVSYTHLTLPTTPYV